MSHKNDVLHGMDKNCEVQSRTISIVRYYLIDEKAKQNLHIQKMVKNHQYSNESIEEFYYDTPSSSLSSLECILMKDTKSMKRYWKFFSFAHDNIMEITTDEREIREPLSRILNYPSPDYITNDLLRIFFSIKITNKIFIIDGCRLETTLADYGFAYCTLEKICIDADRCSQAVDEIETVAKKLGIKYEIEFC